PRHLDRLNEALDRLCRPVQPPPAHGLTLQGMPLCLGHGPCFLSSPRRDERRIGGASQHFRDGTGAGGVTQGRVVIGKVEPARSLLHTASTWVDRDPFSRHGASSMNPFQDNQATVPKNGCKGDCSVIRRGGWFVGEPRFARTKPNLLCPIGGFVND